MNLFRPQYFVLLCSSPTNIINYTRNFNLKEQLGLHIGRHLGNTDLV